jgi:hypothetical protein
MSRAKLVENRASEGIRPPVAGFERSFSDAGTAAKTLAKEQKQPSRRMKAH